jgi:hypothetical protein
MTTLGWRPFYAVDDGDAALILLRRLPAPGLRGWTARARVYVNRGFPTFVRDLYYWPCGSHESRGLRTSITAA